MSKVAMILWALWWRRNQKCWNDFLPTVYDVTRRANESLQDWKGARRHTAVALQTVAVSTEVAWKKPPMGKLKCNIDAACYRDQNLYCVGMCIRDEQGRFVSAYMKRFEGQPDIREAEPMGVLEGLMWLKGMNSSNVLLETDYLQVVQHIGNKIQDKSEYGIILDKCRILLLSMENCRSVMLGDKLTG
jgi:hypothetical protein